jgi:SAM-dependent methyltransferase
MTVHGDHVRRNQEHWTENAPSYAAAAPAQWDGEPSWGIWGIRESSVHLLRDVAGLEVVELGCGTAYVSAWLLRLGARSVVGLDPTAAQLATAAAMQARAGVSFPLVRADARARPVRGRRLRSGHLRIRRRHLV